MKKGICLLLMLLVCTPALAYNKRVAELKIEEEKLQKQLMQLKQAEQNTTIRLIEINAIVNELQREVKEDEEPSKTE